MSIRKWQSRANKDNHGRTEKKQVVCVCVCMCLFYEEGKKWNSVPDILISRSK